MSYFTKFKTPKWVYFDKGQTIVLDHGWRGKESFTFPKKTKGKVVACVERTLKNSNAPSGNWVETPAVVGYAHPVGRFRCDIPYTVINIPPLSKTFRTQAVKDSIWEATQDILLEDYIAKPFKFKKGTKFTIVQDKMVIQHYYGSIGETKCIVVDVDGERYELPAQEVSQYIQLVTPGKTKTYWRLLEPDGTKVSQKRFKNLGAVKASVRVKLGLVKDPEGGKYWLETDRPENFKDWVAVEYDHATDKEIYREELKDWVFIQKI